ncbi:unnamed protein product [Bursaphelenchus okinawaensis]|uniref:BTB domain-containing protein n=1 Tax=Bursaphelenchus okinawaensis TaxID=465554 RepID=A0A811LST0_9BILA|nr:unnamed protein product [Bursaphelenchus okinawaensis]CAG9127532.1 unnamed protein product [Bursaphelenchus okinawaensis]
MNKQPSPAIDVDEKAKSEEPPLVFVTVRQRSAVSRRADDTDTWGIDEIDAKEECKLILKDGNATNSMLSRLNTFRRNRELCDVVLFIKEREILAHKVVLAALSNSLLDMFVSGDESSPKTTSHDSVGNMSYFEFNQGDYECFEALVDFAYTGILSISNRKVADLYKTSYALQVNSVAMACARHLADNLSYGNCIGIRRHANFNNDSYLVNKVDSFINENIDSIISESVEFTQLPCVKLRIIVPKYEQFNQDAGVSLAERSLAYFQKYPKISDRVDQQIEALVQKAHLLFVEEDFSLEDCAKMDDQSSVGSCDVVQDYKRSKQSKSSKSAGHNSQLIGAQPIQHHVTGALPVKINASRVANAKYASNESLNSCASSQTDVEDEIESKMIAVHETSRGFWIALVVLYKKLVVLSMHLTDDEEVAGSGDSNSATPPLQDTKNGNNNNTIVMTKQPTDVQQNSVLAKLANCVSVSRRPLPAMSVARCSVGAAFLNGKIIVCGGYDRGECLKTVEEFDVLGNEWKKLPPMTCERGRFDVAVCGGRIYAVAGSNGNIDLKSAEAYDPKTEKWHQIPTMMKGRSHNGCASLDGYVYSLGGSNDQMALRDCERYNPDSESWEPIAPMQQARQQAGCTSWKGMVVSIGGCDRWNCLDSVEAYDPAIGQWRTLARLSTPRRGCAVAVVRDALYVIGGHDGQQSLNLVEVLDHPNGHWRTAPSLTTPRANTHAVVTAGNAIYVIGGFDGNQFLSSMEVLENESIGWRGWIQTRLSQDIAEEEEEEEPLPKERPDSATPRAAVSVI